MIVIVLYFTLLANVSPEDINSVSTGVDPQVMAFMSSTDDGTLAEDFYGLKKPDWFDFPTKVETTETSPVSNEPNSFGLDQIYQILKISNSVGDDVNGASKIFGSMKQVGGELLGMFKDGATKLVKIIT